MTASEPQVTEGRVCPQVPPAWPAAWNRRSGDAGEPWAADPRVEAWGSACLAEKHLDPGDALAQVSVAQRVGQAKIAAGSESLTRHDGHLGLVQDQCRELSRGGADPAADGLAEQTLDRRVDVERPGRDRAVDTLDLVEHADDRATATVESHLHLVDRVQRSVQSRDSGPLGDVGDVRGRV